MFWKYSVRIALAIFVTMALSASMVVPVQTAQDKNTYLRVVRSIYTDAFGMQKPTGLAFSPEVDAFFILGACKNTVQGASDASDLFLITPFEELAGSVCIPTAISDPVNMAFDGRDNRLYLFESETDELIEIRMGADGVPDPSTMTRFDAGRFGIQSPRGMTVNPSNGQLFILDGALLWIVRIEPALVQGSHGAEALKDGWITQVDLHQIGFSDLQGMAFNPNNGHLYLLSPAEQRLYELTDTGQVVAIRGLTTLDLIDPQGIVFAPSGDPTDDPSLMSLYLLDSGSMGKRNPKNKELGQARIIELALVSPFQAAGSVSTVQASLVQTIDASQFSPPSPDPAGIIYLPTSGTLLISDSEVNEMSIFTGVNIFQATLSGSLVDTMSTTSFSNEPTGIALNPSNGHLFVSDDSARKVFEWDPGTDELFNTPDDIITSFDTRAFESLDPEDVAFDPQSGALFIVDGVNAQVYRVDPGANGVFDGLAPAGDDQVTHFDTAGIGVIDPEGIALHPATGYLYLTGYDPNKISVITAGGALLQQIDISAAQALKPAGVTFAPGSQDPSATHMYICDRGIDNNKDPRENDGKVYEFLTPPISPGNLPPEVSAGPDQTVLRNEGAVLDGTVSDDGLPDPPGTVSAAWSRVSGPGTVSFADASAVDTTAAFSAGGEYVLRLDADDGELQTSAEVTITVLPGAGEAVFEIRVDSSSDDVEERASGSVSVTSSDLELTYDSSEQTVGMRFNGVAVPKDATILGGFLQFQVDEISSEETLLTIQGEDADSAAPLTSSSRNVSSRSKTTAAVPWSPSPWLTVGEAGPNQQSPDIGPVLQEIVNRAGWASGNSLVFIITGTGKRVAESFDGDPGGAPLLQVVYLQGEDKQAPTVKAFDVAATSDSLIVPINTFIATDDIGVTGYLVRESAVAPAAGDPSWSANAPTQYVVSGEGIFTLYGWAKDGAGNVSDSLNDTVEVTLPEMFYPTADAQVAENKATTNFGSEPSLEVKSQGKRTHSYLKFEVFGLEGVVKSAKIRLYAGKSSNGGGSIWSTSNNFKNSTTPWTESGLTWNSAPPPQGSVLSTLGLVSAGTWVEFDVTSAVRENGIFNFVITDSSNLILYNSKEASGNGPVLSIEVGESP